MSVLLEARDIRVSFRKENQTRLFGRERQQVLRGINLTLNERECLGIIGESGSGKSTLGRVLSGLLRPQGGQISILGHDLYARHTRKDAHFLQHVLSVVFQDYTSSANPRFRVSSIIGESGLAMRSSAACCRPSGRVSSPCARSSARQERQWTGKGALRNFSNRWAFRQALPSATPTSFREASCRGCA